MRQYLRKKESLNIPKRMELSQEIKLKLEEKAFPIKATQKQKEIIYKGMEEGWFAHNVQTLAPKRTKEEELKHLKALEKSYSKVLDCLEALEPEQHALLEQDYLAVNQNIVTSNSSQAGACFLYENIEGVEDAILEGERLHYEQSVRLRAAVQYRINTINECWHKEDLEYMQAADYFARAFTNAFPPPEHKISNADNSLFRKLFIIFLKEVLNKHTDPKRIIEKLMNIYR